MAIARFRDAAPLGGLAAGVLRGHQAQIGHELPGILKSPEVSDLDYHGCCDNSCHAAKSLKGSYDWCHAPCWNQFQYLIGQTVNTLRILFDAVDVLLKRDLLGADAAS